MSFSDSDLIKLMDAYADAHPEAEPMDNFAELFDRDELVKILQRANGREIDVEVTYGDEKVDYRATGATYRYV